MTAECSAITKRSHAHVNGACAVRQFCEYARGFLTRTRISYQCITTLEFSNHPIVPVNNFSTAVGFLSKTDVSNKIHGNHRYNLTAIQYHSSSVCRNIYACVNSPSGNLVAMMKTTRSALV